MRPKTSRDLHETPSRKDKEREIEQARVADAPETGDEGRDLVHGEGGTLEIPTKPSDLSKDD